MSPITLLVLQSVHDKVHDMYHPITVEYKEEFTPAVAAFNHAKKLLAKAFRTRKVTYKEISDLEVAFREFHDKLYNLKPRDNHPLYSNGFYERYYYFLLVQLDFIQSSLCTARLWEIEFSKEYKEISVEK